MMIKFDRAPEIGFWMDGRLGPGISAPKAAALSIALCCAFSARVVLAGAPINSLGTASWHNRDESHGTLNLAAYIATLDQWKQSVEGLAAHPRLAERLATQLPRDWRVEVRGQRFLVTTNWLRSGLLSVQANPARASRDAAQTARRLNTLIGDAQALERPASFQVAAARSVLAGILSRREFAGVRGPTRFERWMARARAWIWRIMVRLFGGLRSPFHTRPLLLWLVIGLLAFLLIFGISRTLRSKQPVPRIHFEHPRALPKTWRDGAREAMEQSAQGKYREAIRLAYWATIERRAHLSARPIDRWRTPREYVSLLAGNASERDALAEMTSVFERIWYAGAPASAQDFWAVVEKSEEIGCKLALNPATARS